MASQERALVNAVKRVLIIERDAGLREDLSASLRVSGWQPHPVPDLARGLELLQTAAVDAVLLDLGTPPACARISAFPSELPVVAMAAGATGSDSVAALRHGAAALLRKPFGLRVLEDALVGAIVANDHRARRAPRVLATQDAAMAEVLEQLANAAESDATIQITGESGTGKHTLARFVHELSPRRAGPFVAVNCASLSEEFAERELFGHREDTTGQIAHTVADVYPVDTTGQIAQASGGTLLLDEISELPLPLQPKLLRVLQQREILPQGASQPRPVDVRVIATTQRDLNAEVENGRFRPELLCRLDVVVVRVPALRERIADLPVLARHFLERFAKSSGSEPARLPPDAVRLLSRHPFPGNLRELENLMHRAGLIFPGREIAAAQLFSLSPPTVPAAAAGFTSRTLNLRELERQAVTQSLIASGGNRKRASEALGISPRTLRNKIRQYSLR